MTRCTCPWTEGRDGRFALLLGDPLCPAQAVHARRSGARGHDGGVVRQLDPGWIPTAAPREGGPPSCGCATELHEACPST